MTDSEDAMSEKRQELSPKLRGYGEGVIDGFAAAKELVSKQTNGVFTLNEPREIAEWRALLERCKSGKEGTMSEWQPIETAPKDGSAIIVLTADGEVFNTHWNRGALNFNANLEGSHRYNPGQKGDWWNHLMAYAYEGDGRMYCGFTPTHWMPLPQPPKEARG